jgi:hypothetical protein
MNDLFKREDKFAPMPFIDDEGGVNLWTNLILIVSAIVAILLLMLLPLPQIAGAAIFSGFLLVAYGILSKCRFRLLLGSIKVRYILLMLAILVVSLIISIALPSLLSALGITTASDKTLSSHGSGMNIAILCVQLIGEELYKTLLLLGIAGLLIALIGKRKPAIVWGVIITTIIFCISHYSAYDGNIANLVMLIPSTLLTFYLYIRTKSVALTWIGHFLYDFLPVLAGILQAGK